MSFLKNTDINQHLETTINYYKVNDIVEAEQIFFNLLIKDKIKSAFILSKNKEFTKEQKIKLAIEHCTSSLLASVSDPISNFIITSNKNKKIISTLTETLGFSKPIYYTDGLNKKFIVVGFNSKNNEFSYVSASPNNYLYLNNNWLEYIRLIEL